LPTNPVLVVHGGAWAIPDDMVDAHLNGVRNAASAGWRVLERGGSSLDAVEEAVVVMEDDETFDAGRGSFLNRDGKVQLDALIMDGGTLRTGGVGCVERIANPVRAARKILSESPHVYFVAEGAERFAAEHGIPLCRNEDLIIPREVERLREYLSRGEDHREDIFAPAISHDTVGAVALDRDGNVYVAGYSFGDGFLVAKYVQHPIATEWISATMLTPTVLQFTLRGEAQRSYEIQASIELTHWTTVTRLFNTSGTIPFVDALATNVVGRFYRALKVP